MMLWGGGGQNVLDKEYVCILLIFFLSMIKQRRSIDLLRYFSLKHASRGKTIVELKLKFSNMYMYIAYEILNLTGDSSAILKMNEVC